MMDKREFTDEFKKSFTELNIEIPPIPHTFLIPNSKKTEEMLEFKTAESFENFLIDEQNFWRDHFEKISGGQDGISLCKTTIKKTLVEFNKAVTQIQQNPETAKRTLQSLKAQMKDFIYSKHFLTIELLKYKYESNAFFEGFFKGIAKVDTPIKNQSGLFTKEMFFGVYKALEYLEMIRKMDELSPELIRTFNETQVKFVNTSDRCLQKYDELFKEKERFLNDLDAKVTETTKKWDDTLNELREKHDEKLKDLGILYNEKLRLETPANYWLEMSKEYDEKGRMWLWYSAGILIALVIAMAAVASLFANAYSDSLGALKSTAVFTAMAAAGIFLLRLTIKMSMSSYHLARDAKEREQLSLFYLALKNEKGIDDRERSMVISALFSRSDTGLLKEDSAPKMPIAESFDKQ